MESLLAAYASASEDEEQEEEREESCRPLFSGLPPPKKVRVSVQEDGDDDLVATTSRSNSGLFTSLPPPSRKAGKGVVLFKPPVDVSLLREDGEDGQRRRKSDPASEAPVSVLGNLVLPAPRNTGAVLGAGAAGGMRLMGLSNKERQKQAQEFSEPEGYAVGYEQQQYAEQQQHYTDAEQQQYTDVAQQQQQYSAAEGYEAQQYMDAYYYYQTQVGDDQAQPHGTFAQQDQGNEEDPVAKADRRRDRLDAVKFVSIKQDDLTANRPRQDLMRLTGIAFGDQRGTEGMEKPSKLHKRKHQIGSLLYDLKQKELELAEKRAQGKLSRAQTHAKYGW